MMRMGEVRWLFVHTAAFDGEAGVGRIREWHTDPPRNWDDIGYHYVVRRDGTVEEGRSVEYAGAHVQGVNTRSIGICCEGHGDHEALTNPQGNALIALLRRLMDQYEVPVRCVLGHNEVNGLIDIGEVGDQYRTTKTCPGRNIGMTLIRALLHLPPPDVRRIYSDTHDVDRAA